MSNALEQFITKTNIQKRINELAEKYKNIKI